MNFKSEFLRELAERGYIHQCSDEKALDEALCNGVITAYVGYDCTAPSLHIGNLLSVMMLRKLQQHGHKPVVLIGGGTTKVGDPSGKDESRQLLDDARIDANIKGIGEVFGKFISFDDGPAGALIVNNRDWLDNINYIEFLRDYGRHFTINRMLGFDSVKLRLEREQSLTFLEFNYMILQAYDFLELNRRHSCTLQMGGSDQWGNIVNGIELARKVDRTELFALTVPLLTTSSGAKMGKTASGAVWLNENMLGPYDYWQYWRNTEDADVGRFLRLFTELPLAEIEQLASLEGSELNEAKKILATEACAMLHGREKANAAAKTASEAFEHGKMAKGLPSISVPEADLDAGIGILTLLVRAGLAGSNSEARRHVKSGAVRINSEKIANERIMVTTDYLADDGVVKLSVGKKRHVLLKVGD
jgi:tyrosyl-tRNA synthetase